MTVAETVMAPPGKDLTGNSGTTPTVPVSALSKIPTTIQHTSYNQHRQFAITLERNADTFDTNNEGMRLDYDINNDIIVLWRVLIQS
jgi:hypothetical protein